MDTAIAEFVAITGADAEQATQLLEASNGNLETAVANYFEIQSGDPEPADMADSQPPSPVPQAQPPTLTTGLNTLGNPALPSASAPRTNVPTGRRTGMATLGDLAREAAPPNPDAPQDFFAGGGRSGLNVQDPTQRKKPGQQGKLIQDILSKAAEGTQAREAEEPTAGPSNAFHGTGYSLGSDDVPSRVLPDPTAPRSKRQKMPGGLGAVGGDEEGGSDEEEEGTGAEVVSRVLTFWADGFTIDDGELMKYEEHKEVLEALNSGRAPLSLLGVKFGQAVDVQVDTRFEENYRPSGARKLKPTSNFVGEGNRLGAPVSAMASASSAASPPSTSTGTALPPAATLFEVDASQPTTNIQIRLGDGSRMVAKFNHTHTIADVIKYINASRPASSTRAYVLQTTFPNRDLNDLSQTLKEGDLLGSVLVQRFT